MHACMLSCSIVSDSLWLHGTPWTVVCQVTLTWYYPSKNTIMSCHFLFQGIILIQGSNWHHLCLMHCRWIIYHYATTEAPYISIITLNVNWLNVSTKQHRLAKQMKMCMYAFPLTTSFCLTHQIVCNYFILLD